MSILVTGGAGYIGSATVEELHAHGREVVVIDNLSRGHRAAVPSDVAFYRADIADAATVRRIVETHRVDACIHFAAFAYVGESVTDPAAYFENNVAHGVALLDALLGLGVRRLVFSSTCATYGVPRQVPITEAHPQHPVNPYGWSKFFMERILESYDAAYGLKFVALRYFNAAGATPTHGEHHEPETHLIPNILAVASGKRPFVSIFGSDYPTPDGTAIRDYIHISDLARAHVAALDHLRDGGASTCVNLGNGTGYSALEVVAAARRVTEKPIETRLEARRAGDPAHLVADATKARQTFGWSPQIPDLDDIIHSAWAWHRNHPHGYED
jgi:UDP-glucose 4-epimerase